MNVPENWAQVAELALDRVVSNPDLPQLTIQNVAMREIVLIWSWQCGSEARIAAAKLGKRV